MTKNTKTERLFFSRTLDFLDHYLPEQAKKSDNTVETYRDALTVFRRYLSEILKISIRTFRFEDCTYEILLSYLEYLQGIGNAPSTCNNRLAAIRAYLWYVADCNISVQTAALNASHVPFLRVPRRIRETISDEDLAALLSAPPNTKMGRRDQMIMILLYDSAVRVSELLSLDVRSVNLDAQIPYVRIHGKGDKERIVAITDVTARHLPFVVKFISHHLSKKVFKKC